jgi:uncharacterized membrane protein
VALREGDYLLLILVLSVVGLLIGAYTTYLHYSPDESAFCNIDDFLNCEVVGNSTYAVLFGIPVAVIGLGGFVALVFLAAARFLWYDAPLTGRFPLLILVFAGAGSAFSAYLTYLEFFVIYALCILCFAAFFLILAVFGLAYGHWRLTRREAETVSAGHETDDGVTDL